MTDEKNYDKARELAEKSLTKSVDGDDEAAERLAEEAAVIGFLAHQLEGAGPRSKIDVTATEHG